MPDTDTIARDAWNQWTQSDAYRDAEPQNGDDFIAGWNAHALAVATKSTVEPSSAPRVVCGGCGETVAPAGTSTERLATLQTEHDARCWTHAIYGGCRHDGPCYLEVPEHTDGSM